MSWARADPAARSTRPLPCRASLLEPAPSRTGCTRPRPCPRAAWRGSADRTTPGGRCSGQRCTCRPAASRAPRSRLGTSCRRRCRCCWRCCRGSATWQVPAAVAAAAAATAGGGRTSRQRAEPAVARVAATTSRGEGAARSRLWAPFNEVETCFNRQLRWAFRFYPRTGTPFPNKPRVYFCPASCGCARVQLAASVPAGPCVTLSPHIISGLTPATAVMFLAGFLSCIAPRCPSRCRVHR